jgi:hypothetical protein
VQLRNWSEFYKHYSTWVALGIIFLNLLVLIFGLIPLAWVAPINTILGSLVVVAKAIKQSLDSANAILEETKKPEE